MREMEKRDIPKFTLDDVAAVLESVSKFDGKIATRVVVRRRLLVPTIYLRRDRHDLWACRRDHILVLCALLLVRLGVGGRHERESTDRYEDQRPAEHDTGKRALES